jgi:hypothetical protein
MWNKDTDWKLKSGFQEQEKVEKSPSADAAFPDQGRRNAVQTSLRIAVDCEVCFFAMVTTGAAIHSHR